MLGAVPGVPALGRGPVPGDYSRHDLTEALREVIANASKDTLYLTIEATLDKTCRATPAIFDRLAARINIITEPLELADHLVLRTRLFVDPLERTFHGKTE